ncbi:hypothetical protein Gotri_026125, partial [Gossypium trilobum]|nr:hypothetical protein [Gossypium trilobum]
IADSSFKNLSSLKLRNCKNCKSLPSVGRLPLLKDLSIIGFDQVQKIGVQHHLPSADISVPSEGFPANLTSLALSNAPKIYRSLME